MRVLIAPDKFKGTMTAREAARAMALGVRDACAERGIEVEIDECPMADGGDGTLEVIEMALENCERRIARVTQPLPGYGTEVEWLHWVDEQGHVCGLVEVAQIIGLARVPADKRDPERLSTRNVGSVIDQVMRAGCDVVYVALGGTATVDGGIGAASALGVKFQTRTSLNRYLSGSDLADIMEIDRNSTPPYLQLPARLVAWCDVDAPLGAAARVFAPQKGASPEQVKRLEHGLRNLYEVANRCLDFNGPSEGAGAGGGLGFGLEVLLGAEIEFGSFEIAEAVGLPRRVADTDCVITGEGRFDHQSRLRKVVEAVAHHAGRGNKPVIVVCGSAEEPIEPLLVEMKKWGISIDGVTTLTSAAPSGEAAMKESPTYATIAAEQAMGAWLDAGGRRGV